MSLKRGGAMNRSCVYYCEGEDDLQLIDSLKLPPGRILPGKAKKFNVIQNLLPKSILVGIKPGSIVVLVFDTDVSTNLSVVKKNIENITKYCRGVKLVYLLQVKNLEDELVRCTDIQSIIDLTKSKSLRNFKTDFKRLKATECRRILERHNIGVGQLWTTKASDSFKFAKRNSAEIKTL